MARLAAHSGCIFRAQEDALNASDLNTEPKRAEQQSLSVSIAVTTTMVKDVSYQLGVLFRRAAPPTASVVGGVASCFGGAPSGAGSTTPGVGAAVQLRCGMDRPS